MLYLNEQSYNYLFHLFLFFFQSLSMFARLYISSCLLLIGAVLPTAHPLSSSTLLLGTQGSSTWCIIVGDTSYGSAAVGIEIKHHWHHIVSNTQDVHVSWSFLLNNSVVLNPC